MLCREFDKESVKDFVAEHVGPLLTKGAIVDFADLYVQHAEPPLTVREQETLMRELWAWREVYCA